MSKGLTNKYVEKTCRDLFGKSFIGVFPCDIHPKINTNKQQYSLIFNTGDSSTAGEHFVAIYFNKKTFYYFDSFGRKPDDNNIIKFLSKQICKQRRKKKLIVWNKPVQDVNSSYCGFYCIGFLLHKYYKFKNFEKIFQSNNLINNDKIITNFIIKNIPKL